jgi:hypothetical protein
MKMSELPRYGDPARGVTQVDVGRAADALLRAGERPTVEKIRATIGSGSPNTVGPLLDTWWKRLAGRLDAGPAAFHRLPESVAHVAEALWMRALEEGRRCALLEQRMTDRALAQDKERLELRSHVLTLREGEMEARVQERERTIANLESRLHVLTSILQKEQANRDSLTRRLSVIEAESLAACQVRTLAPKRKSRTRQSKTAVKGVRQTERAPLKRKPARTARKRKQPK